ncbi:hypothetical protein GCM10010343_30000 [Streptomyces avidinii]|nr:hypothetical protein GCM10010343_30000 [Streptomyces avidinii]
MIDMVEEKGYVDRTKEDLAALALRGQAVDAPGGPHHQASGRAPQARIPSPQLSTLRR